MLQRTRCPLELLDPGQHAQIFVVAQVRVVSVGVPGVEGMEANHVQALRSSREREREVAPNVSFLRPLALFSSSLIYLLWDGAIVELHHPVEILCRQGMIQFLYYIIHGSHVKSNCVIKIFFYYEFLKLIFVNCTVMAPGHVDVLQPTFGCIYPIFSALKKSIKQGYFKWTKMW